MHSDEDAVQPKFYFFFKERIHPGARESQLNRKNDIESNILGKLYDGTPGVESLL